MNDRLNDAAEDLLAACQEILDWTNRSDNQENGNFIYFAEVIVPLVDEAVAKATGRIPDDGS